MSRAFATCPTSLNRRAGPGQQRGASLIMVMLILIVVSVIGVGGIQIAMMGERGARNDRDLQVAWQAAEEGLIDAENDIYGTSTRRSIFTNSNMNAFVDSCAGTGTSLGLCNLVTSGKPAWLTTSFTDTTKTVGLGAFTSRTLPNSGGTGTGIRPYQVPRYIIEPIRDPSDRDIGNATPSYVYRVTAMGFGPRQDIQAVVQMVYRQ